MKLPVNYNELTATQRRAVREEYVRLQNGSCHFCGNKLSGHPVDDVRGAWIDESLFPRGFFSSPVHLHHSHETGMTIGAVHARCNAVMWQYHGE